MEEAKKLVLKLPVTPRGQSPSPIQLPDITSSTIVELLKDITEEVDDIRTPVATAKKPTTGRPGGPVWIKGSSTRIGVFDHNFQYHRSIWLTSFIK